jgi:hypothetical protein
VSRIKREVTEVNQILVWEPRWHDRVVLVAERRILAVNEVIIQHHDFPEPFYLTAEEARKWPVEDMRTKAGGTIQVRVIPLSALSQEVINART